jgi:hypothetical protein
MERHRIAPIQTFIELYTLGEGSWGHEAPHHAAVLELVPDRVHMVWVGFLKEPIEVVHRQPRLTLVAACGGWDASHAGATCLLVFVVIVVGHGRGPLKALLAPLLAALDALHAAVDGTSLSLLGVASLLP